jgi:tetratricopeptide (TPR) repeat protein
MFHRIFVFISTLLIVLEASAQGQDEHLAAQYFANGEYEKASVVYERLLSKKTADVFVYDNLLKCYINLKSFDEAERVIKRSQKQNYTNPSFAVDLAYIAKLKGKTDVFRSRCEALIKNMKADEAFAEQLSKAFQKRGEYAYAAEVYLKFRKLSKAELAFSLELAELFAQQGLEVEMITEFLNLLSYDDSQLDNVQSFLSEYFEGKKEGVDLLKKSLLKKIADESGKMVFPELLIWLYTEQQQYEAAFVQCKAVDRRFKLNGRRIYQFAELAKDIDMLDLSARAYQAVIELGVDKPFTISAKYGLLEVRNKKLLLGNYTKTDLLELEAEYIENIRDLGVNHLSANFIKDLAHLQAFYLNKTDTAILLLKDLAYLSGVNSQVNARAKLELGDIYLFKGEVWEATLLYEQVDYDLKEEPLGQEAKYKNAQLCYFMGDFEWAKAQLDVLKSATSQLISNNSIELLMIILDNTGLDTTEMPLQLYAKADLFIYRNKPDSALTVLEKLERLFPDNELTDDILFQKGKIALLKGNYETACMYLERVWKNYPDGILADNALITCARIYEKQLNLKTKALDLYDNFIRNYPGSFFISEARSHYRLLRGDNLPQ